MSSPTFNFLEADTLERMLERILFRNFERFSEELEERISKVAEPLRFASPFLHEEDAAAYLRVARSTIADLRLNRGVPFDTRTRHRQVWYSRASLDAYISGEIGPGND